MSQEASDILKARSLVNRHLYQQKISDVAEAWSEQSSPTIYTGFDVELGLGRLQDDNGNIFYGSAQTNGAVGLGENIRLRRGGVLAKYDAMPRKKIELNVEPIINKPYRVKTLFYLYNSDGIHLDIYIGGDRPTPQKILNTDISSIGYITNLGTNKYLASVKYTEARLRKYLFKSNKLKEPVAITNPIINGVEYYLGNGLWESNSGSPTRNMIHDLEIHNFPVDIVEAALYDTYGRALRRNKVDAYASTWTPENPNSLFSFKRTLVSYVYGELDPTNYLQGVGVSYILPSTISFSFTYPDESYTFPDGGKSQFSLQINGGTFGTGTSIATAQPATFYFSLRPTSNSSPTNVASIPDGAYFPGIFASFLFHGGRQNYSNWLTTTINSVTLIDGTYPLLGLEVHNPDGTTTITYTFPNGGTTIWGFIPTPPLGSAPTLIPPVIEENYLENYSGIFLAQQTTDGYLYQIWSATRKIKIGNFVDESDNEFVETNNVITLKVKPTNKLGNTIILDNSDFLIISSWTSLSDIDKDSTNVVLVCEQTYNKDFKVNSAIGQPILFNVNIDEKVPPGSIPGNAIRSFPALIRGVISNAVYTNTGKLTINVIISKISLKTYTSFLNKLITDNGSYYSYFFRKASSSHFGSFINKSILKVIPLNPIASTFLSDTYINEISGINSCSDNIVNKKIYSVVSISDSNASVEKWDIQADGKIKYNGVFTTPYYKIPKDSVIFCNSFHPL
ncbi:MAG: hypothetical protein V7K21_19185 [Nostoc sp.]|uniref:hypothetical protein n=1 Tax=Nostoc sp. TaxID=1180 RepID=UPI002FF85FA1